MSYPARASLLTPLDTPRNQDPNRTGNRLCCFYGTRKALEGRFDRDPAWAGKRLSISYLRHIGEMVQGVPAGSGINPGAMARALEFYGACLQSDYNDGENAFVTPPDEAFKAAKALMPIRMIAMPYIEGDKDGLASMRHWISRGYHLIAVEELHPGKSLVSGPTGTHRWDTTGTPYDTHVTCFVGYEPDHFFTADSGYGFFGDSRGCVGYTFDKLVAGPSRCITSLWLIAECPAQPKPVEGYMPELAKLTLAEMGPEVAFARAALKAAEDAATEAKRAEWTERVLRHQPAGATGWQWIVDGLIKEDLTDRAADICFRQVPGWFLGQCDALKLDTSKLRKDLS